MSINRNAAGVTEHTADFITFNQQRTGGVIGAATTTQQNNGYDQPNIQSAIDDIWEKALVIPGTVYQTVSATDPSVAPTVTRSQVVQLTLSGTPTANGNLVVAGATIAVLTSDTPTSIATKISTTLSGQSFISSASATGAVVTYTYNDSNAHPVDNTIQLGVTMSTKTTTYGGTPGYLGYGSWELLGSETKYTRTIYSWLRIA